MSDSTPTPTIQPTLIQCPACTSDALDEASLICNECGWYADQDEDEDEDDADSGDGGEGRMLAGMEGGSRGLADYDGLELDGPDGPNVDSHDDWANDE